jgi:hypothetical protein
MHELAKPQTQPDRLNLAARLRRDGPMSITHDEIRTTVARYLARHPDEADHLQPLTDALAAGTDLTSRKKFKGGHVTCGAVVIDDTRRLLLIRHIALGRWLLPGGHLEPEDGTLP